MSYATHPSLCVISQEEKNMLELFIDFSIIGVIGSIISFLCIKISEGILEKIRKNIEKKQQEKKTFP